MAINLHRCSNIWVKAGGHPCWRVQKALDETGIEYEVVKEAWLPWKRRPTVDATGQKKFPWIEFEDGQVYRAESKEMEERIRAGKLVESSEAAPGAEAASEPTSG